MKQQISFFLFIMQYLCWGCKNIFWAPKQNFKQMEKKVFTYVHSLVYVYLDLFIF